MPDYAESECDRWPGGLQNGLLIVWAWRMMRHSPPVGGFFRKLKSTPSHCRTPFTPFCPRGSSRLPVGVSQYLFNRFWNGSVPSGRVVPPHSKDRHGRDYAASRSVQPHTGVAATLSIRHNPALGIAPQIVWSDSRYTGCGRVSL